MLDDRTGSSEPIASRPKRQRPLGVSTLSLAVAIALGATSDFTEAAGSVDEIRIGAAAHDAGLITRRREDGIDLNAEILFDSPALFDVIWSPRPHLGATINTSGDTSFLYFGLTWDWQPHPSWFLEASFGGAVHNGDNSTDDPDEKQLGCSLQFREALGIGYRLNRNANLSLYADHISNGSLCSENEGLDTVGLRYGYVF